ncbi:hypothetical protein DXG01_009265, partial [Tephrocybe rancida]
MKFAWRNNITDLAALNSKHIEEVSLEQFEELLEMDCEYGEWDKEEIFVVDDDKDRFEPLQRPVLTGCNWFLEKLVATGCATVTGLRFLVKTGPKPDFRTLIDSLESDGCLEPQEALGSELAELRGKKRCHHSFVCSVLNLEVGLGGQRRVVVACVRPFSHASLLTPLTPPTPPNTMLQFLQHTIATLTVRSSPEPSISAVEEGADAGEPDQDSEELGSALKELESMRPTKELR